MDQLKTILRIIFVLLFPVFLLDKITLLLVEKSLWSLISEHLPSNRGRARLIVGLGALIVVLLVLWSTDVD